ncbi:MAG: LytTR family transcriptional regulator, partial [Calditrichaeota bacterium]|nr:LytTR family transcriptional regulator [Calditrichota bacterium]
LKPFDFARFLMAVTKAKTRLSPQPIAGSDFFFVNTGSQKRRLVYNEICYIEGEGNYVKYVTKTESVLVRASIRETLAQLPESLFVQIHRSFIVSLQYIDKIEDNHVYIANKMIPVGATWRDAFLKRIG